MSIEARRTTVWLAAALAFMGWARSGEAQTSAEQISAQPSDRSGWSGVWMLEAPTAALGSEPPPMTDWGRAQYASHRPTLGARSALDANDPTLACMPPGMPYIWVIPTPFELIALDDRIVILFEYDHSVRNIHIDGRGHPDDLASTGVYQWMGHSIGRWEQDTLVVETVGFNARTWLDRAGHPHSEELRIVERLHRPDQDTLVNEITVDDPKAYTRPWTAELRFRRRPDWQIFEHICVSGDEVDREYAEFLDKTWQPAPGR